MERYSHPKPSAIIMPFIFFLGSGIRRKNLVCHSYVKPFMGARQRARERERERGHNYARSHRCHRAASDSTATPIYVNYAPDSIPPARLKEKHRIARSLQRECFNATRVSIVMP